MIDLSNYIYKELKNKGYNLIVNVPSSYLSRILLKAELDKKIKYITVNNEEEALGIVSGAQITNKKAVLLCQSDGLGKVINALCSFNISYKLPVMILSDLRGQKGEENDAHTPLGKKIKQVLKILDSNVYCIDSIDHIRKVINEATAQMLRYSRPTIIFLLPGLLNQVRSCVSNQFLLSRVDAIKQIISVARKNNALIVSSLGYCSREVYNVEDSNNNLYVLGSMGLTLTIAIGITHGTSRKLICIIGDGELLCNLGSLTTLANYGKNISVVVMDNECYSSTGGQKSSTGFKANPEEIARGCGIKYAFTIHKAEELDRILNKSVLRINPSFINVKINNNECSLKRIKEKPHQLMERFKRNL